MLQHIPANLEIVSVRAFRHKPMITNMNAVWRCNRAYGDFGGDHFVSRRSGALHTPEIGPPLLDDERGAGSAC